jgi:hypothetical protein
MARRLAGAEPQGPASRSVTALHHNPAMLARLQGAQAVAVVSGGVDHLALRRARLDAAGLASGTLGPTRHTVAPSFGYFTGASFRLDPFAVGIGVYDLGSRLRTDAPDEFSYHLAPRDDFGCGGDECAAPRTGGAWDLRTDISLAFAWNAFDRAQVGLALHLPRLGVHLARDEDGALASTELPLSCGTLSDVDIEDPRCAVRVAFDGRMRAGRGAIGTAVDLAFTIGLAVPIGERWNLGARFRTQPVLNRGSVVLDGTAVVCRPGGGSAEASTLPSCEDAPRFAATVSEVLPREVAIGTSAELGDRRGVALDTNLYWVDACPGGRDPFSCRSAGSRTLNLVGFTGEGVVAPQTTLYRGRVDVFGFETWTRLRLATLRSALRDRTAPGIGPIATTMSEETAQELGPRIELVVGTNLRSPGTRPSALTAAESSGWLLGASLGASLEFPRKRGSLFVVPGWSIDVLLPKRLDRGAFDPAAALDFVASGRDINGPGADAWLDGRARPTNEGSIAGAAHAVMVSIRWADRTLDLNP